MTTHEFLKFPQIPKKHLSLIPLTIFPVVKKKRNKRAFERVKDDFDRIRDRWFQTINFLLMGHPLYSIENFRNLTNILIDM